MSIEINGPPSRPITEAGDRSAVRPRTGQNGTSTAAEAGRTSGGAADRISLTSQAAQLQSLESEIANAPVVDTQRVREVQHSIATGSFQVDPARVADKLLRFEAGMSSGSPA